jgi:hypothetical protein
MSSTESVCALDASPGTLDGDHLELAKGDCPDYYYTIAVERWMLPWFTIGSVSTKELNVLLRGRGLEELPEAGGRRFLAFKVLVMGWNWSVYIAEVILEDILQRTGSILLPERRLRHGAVTPKLLRKVPVWLTHVDDVAAWIRAGTKRLAQSEAKEILLLITAMMEEAGLRVHKIEQGQELEVVG